jgi:hypothetical protein
VCNGEQKCFSKHKMDIADHVLLTVTHPSEWYDADTIISPFLCQLFTSWTKEESPAIFVQLWRFALAYFVLTCWHKYCNIAPKRIRLDGNQRCDKEIRSSLKALTALSTS